MIERYGNVWDIQRFTDGLLAPQNLRVSGGTYHENRWSLVLGVQNRVGLRHGDVYCALAEGGWSNQVFWPSPEHETGDRLRFTVLHGAGKLIVPYACEVSCKQNEITTELSPSQPLTFGFINDAPDRPLVVQAQHSRHTGLPTEMSDLGAGVFQLHDRLNTIPVDQCSTYGYDEGRHITVAAR